MIGGWMFVQARAPGTPWPLTIPPTPPIGLGLADCLLRSLPAEKLVTRRFGIMNRRAGRGFTALRAFLFALLSGAEPTNETDRFLERLRDGVVSDCLIRGLVL